MLILSKEKKMKIMKTLLTLCLILAMATLAFAQDIHPKEEDVSGPKVAAK